MTLPFRRARSAVRPSPIFLAIIAVAVVGGYLSWTATEVTRSARFGVFLLILGGWLISLCLHEFAHAFLAWRFGDDEVVGKGYLTLNPLKYSSPLISIVLPLLFIAIGGIGMPGGAVYLHPQRFRTDLQRALVSLSGPAVNVVCAVVALIFVRMSLETSEHQIFWLGIAGLALFQVMASVLNLLPIPGLDGFGAIEPYLDPSFRRAADQIRPFGLLVVFLLLFQVQSISNAFFDIIDWLFELSGVSSVAGHLGIQLLRFWQKT